MGLGQPIVRGLLAFSLPLVLLPPAVASAEVSNTDLQHDTARSGPAPLALVSPARISARIDGLYDPALLPRRSLPPAPEPPPGRTYNLLADAANFSGYSRYTGRAPKGSGAYGAKDCDDCRRSIWAPTRVPSGSTTDSTPR